MRTWVRPLTGRTKRCVVHEIVPAQFGEAILEFITKKGPNVAFNKLQSFDGTLPITSAARKDKGVLGEEALANEVVRKECGRREGAMVGARLQIKSDYLSRLRWKCNGTMASVGGTSGSDRTADANRVSRELDLDIRPQVVCFDSHKSSNGAVTQAIVKDFGRDGDTAS